jgi:hypothetical protein
VRVTIAQKAGEIMAEEFPRDPFRQPPQGKYMGSLLSPDGKSYISIYERDYKDGVLRSWVQEAQTNGWRFEPSQCNPQWWDPHEAWHRLGQALEFVAEIGSFVVHMVELWARRAYLFFYIPPENLYQPEEKGERGQVYS